VQRIFKCVKLFQNTSLIVDKELNILIYYRLSFYAIIFRSYKLLKMVHAIIVSTFSIEPFPLLLQVQWQISGSIQIRDSLPINWWHAKLMVFHDQFSTGSGHPTMLLLLKGQSLLISLQTTLTYALQQIPWEDKRTLLCQLNSIMLLLLQVLSLH